MLSCIVLYVGVLSCDGSDQHYVVYLTGCSFELWTDHKALESLFKLGILNRRLTGWALYLQEFSFILKYWPGSKNGNADGMSRQAWRTTTQEMLGAVFHPGG